MTILDNFAAEITHEPAMPIPAGFTAGSRAYHVKLTYTPTGQSMTVPFYSGPANGEPTMLDVLSCVASDASTGALDFDDFCSDLGYSQDSRSAHATWQACQTYNGELLRIVGDVTDFGAVIDAASQL